MFVPHILSCKRPPHALQVNEALEQKEVSEVNNKKTDEDETSKKLTQAGVDGASAFLSRICLPAAEEFGLLLKDKVSGWRANNAVKIAHKAKKILEEHNRIEVSSHPKIVYSTLENGSWAEDDLLQDLWAGLLASSCTETGKDDSNHILVNLLAQIVSSQVNVLCFACTNAEVFKNAHGLIYAEELIVNEKQVIEIAGIDDVHQLDRELDHLRALGLIDGGFDIDSHAAGITPTPLCLHLYVRSQGFVGAPVDYFDCPEKEKENKLLNSFKDALDK